MPVTGLAAELAKLGWAQAALSARPTFGYGYLAVVLAIYLQQCVNGTEHGTFGRTAIKP
jgi:hypothetical protein